MRPCPACGGECELLGALGEKLWYRCVRCWYEHYEEGNHYE